MSETLETTFNLREAGERARAMIDETGWTKHDMWRFPEDQLLVADEPLPSVACKTGTHCVFGALAIAILPEKIDGQLVGFNEWDMYFWGAYTALENAIKLHDPDNPLGIEGYIYNDNSATSREDVIARLSELPDVDVRVKWEYAFNDDQFSEYDEDEEHCRADIVTD